MEGEVIVYLMMCFSIHISVLSRLIWCQRQSRYSSWRRVSEEMTKPKY